MKCDAPDSEKGDKAACSLCIKSNVVCAYVEPSKRRRTSRKDTATKVSSCCGCEAQNDRPN